MPDDTAPVESTAAQAYTTRAAELHAAAVTTLTDAVRLTHPEHGPNDFAGFLAGVLAEVAANVGSVARVVAGRPSSWEAEALSEFISSTVGYDESIAELAPYRTAPIVLPLNVATLVSDAAMPGPDPYQAELDAVTDPDSDTLDGIAAKWTRKFEAYAAAFTAAVQASAAQIPELRVPVTVEAITDPDLWGDGEASPDDSVTGDAFVNQLWDKAYDSLTLPTADDD